jgi:hypothetical protein
MRKADKTLDEIAFTIRDELAARLFLAQKRPEPQQHIGENTAAS